MLPTATAVIRLPRMRSCCTSRLCPPEISVKFRVEVFVLVTKEMFLPMVIDDSPEPLVESAQRRKVGEAVHLVTCIQILSVSVGGMAEIDWVEHDIIGLKIDVIDMAHRFFQVFCDSVAVFVHEAFITEQDAIG